MKNAQKIELIQRSICRHDENMTTSNIEELDANMKECSRIANEFTDLLPMSDPRETTFKVPEIPNFIDNGHSKVFRATPNNSPTTTISDLHLSGSYLDINSLVSLDDVLIIPSQISIPTI